MEEKLIMSDTLGSLNSSLHMLNYAIQQANDKNFRDYLIGVRNQVEAFQWQTYEIAKQKGFYKTSAPAGQADISTVKKELTAG